MLDSLARRLDALFMALPDSTRWFDHRFSKTWVVVVAILAVTVITRASVFGDPNYHIDEAYYFLVGQRMQAGDLLYVDIWDRKPPGLYLIYRALAEISHDFWIVHLAAGASAAATAFLIYRMSRLIAPRQGALFAALCYLILLPKFGGAGGQSPVLYNLPMALAAWLILDHPGPTRSRRRELLAMFSAGCAMTIKQTALFEGAFMGLWLLWCHRSAGLSQSERWIRALQLAISGALPTIAYFAWYAANGHFDILWQSVVGSNLARDYNPEGNQALRLMLFTAAVSLPLGAALLAAVLNMQRLRTDPKFCFFAMWLAVALTSFLAIPNKFDFYLIPIFLPMTILGAAFYARRDFGVLIFAIISISFLNSGKCFGYEDRRNSREEITALASSIQLSNQPSSLFVYGGPVFLYSMTSSKPLIELAFPPHLYESADRDASPFNTKSQVLKALSAMPYSVIMENRQSNSLYNADLDKIVSGYVKNCRIQQNFNLRNIYVPYTVTHYSNCGSN